MTKPSIQIFALLNREYMEYSNSISILLGFHLSFESWFLLSHLDQNLIYMSIMWIMLLHSLLKCHQFLEVSLSSWVVSWVLECVLNLKMYNHVFIMDHGWTSCVFENLDMSSLYMTCHVQSCWVINVIMMIHWLEMSDQYSC